MQLKNINIPLKNFSRENNLFFWILFICLSICISFIASTRLILNIHKYNIGDVVKKDLKAPRDFYYKDFIQTKIKKEHAEKSVLLIYNLNNNIKESIKKRVNNAFSTFAKQPLKAYKNPANPKKKQNNIQQIEYNRDTFQNLLEIKIKKETFQLLQKKNFRKKTSSLIIKITSQILDNGIVDNKESLLKESDKGIFLINPDNNTKQKIKNVKTLYSLEQAKTMVRIIGQPLLLNLNYTTTNTIVNICQQLLVPNIIFDLQKTTQLKEIAKNQVKTILTKIKKGEMLLREGEIVNSLQLNKLQYLNKLNEHNELTVNKTIGIFFIIFAIFLTNYFIYIKQYLTKSYLFNTHMVFLTSILIVFCLIIKLTAYLSESLAFLEFADTMIYGIPIAAASMTICLFLGINAALPFAIVLSICAAIIFNGDFNVFIYYLLNCSMGAYWMLKCKERKVFIKAGLKLGLLNIVLAFALQLYKVDLSWSNLLTSWAFALSGGLMSGILTAGIAPLIELSFNYTTDIKLLELANLDQPLLRQLMLKAPGTYHHSLIVGTMVEAAASEIGVNPLLAKTCGYYHDIGKIDKPLYYIENQQNGKNRHDKLAPSMSALILISHIKRGVEIATENKLGKPIIDTIQQHHGTSLIKYFFDKAKLIRGEDNININDFRYPGPKPQSRVAGLVMIADVIEASSRTLENPTPARIQGHIQQFINKIFSDEQLNHCNITLNDLHKIAKTFNKILNGIYHHRIEYTGNPQKSQTWDSNENSDKQSAKKISGINKSDKNENTSHLKRLGQS